MRSSLPAQAPARSASIRPMRPAPPGMSRAIFMSADRQAAPAGGTGTLTISNGGQVTVDGATYVGIQDPAASLSQGSIAFTGTGGTLTTKSLYVDPTNLSGTGTINANGLVSDVDLTFSNSSIANVVMLAAWPSPSLRCCRRQRLLGAGYNNNGTLTIQAARRSTRPTAG